MRLVRVYADEDIPAELVEFARNHLGWNVVYVCEHEAWCQRCDVWHHRQARMQGRLLLTRDKDFLDPTRFPYHKCPGVIVLEGRKPARLRGLLQKVARFRGRDTGGRSLEFSKCIVSEAGLRRRYQDEAGLIQEQRYQWAESSALDR